MTYKLYLAVYFIFIYFVTVPSSDTVGDCFVIIKLYNYFISPHVVDLAP